METQSALTALSALSQPTRLDVFRLLVKHSPDGLFAGQIAETLDVRQNTLSSNLALLTEAGLITRTREGRAIRYTAQIDAMRDLVGFLLEDCCGGDPSACGPISDQFAPKEACS